MKKPAKKQQRQGTIAYDKGHRFEEVVAKWAKRKFNLDKVDLNQQFKGKVAVRPFEIDIVGLKKASGLLVAKEVVVFWIECKDREASIKRTDINKLYDSAVDVKKAVPSITWSGLSKQQVKMSWDNLVFVSSSTFDVDALNFAEKHNIACYYYDGKTFKKMG